GGGKEGRGYNKVRGVSRGEASGGVLREHIQANLPLIIRSAMGAQYLDRWDPQSLMEEYRGHEVTALVYNKEEDQRQHIFTSTLELTEFVNYSQNVTQIMDQLPVQDPAIY
ncbi:unnamed protein product, partial [Discosporangium mesarthrocarpum]